MGLPVQNAGPDLAMLFLGMKLITTPAIDITDSTLYDTTKSFLASLESNGVVSLLCLQAMILVALYEYSHAIYQAAWMTVGSCARYADILGITPGDYCPLGQVVRAIDITADGIIISALLDRICEDKGRIKLTYP